MEGQFEDRGRGGPDRRTGIPQSTFHSGTPHRSQPGADRGSMGAMRKCGIPEGRLARPPFPSQTRAVHPKLNQSSMLNFCDINSSAIRAAETYVARQFPKHTDFLQNLRGRGELYNRSLAMASDVKIAIDIAAH